MIFVITESHRFFEDWCYENGEDPKAKKFVVYVNSYKPTRGRMRRDGDEVLILGSPHRAVLEYAAVSLIPCGFDWAERNGQSIRLRDLLT